MGATRSIKGELVLLMVDHGEDGREGGVGGSGDGECAVPLFDGRSLAIISSSTGSEVSIEQARHQSASRLRDRNSQRSNEQKAHLPTQEDQSRPEADGKRETHVIK